MSQIIRLLIDAPLDTTQDHIICMQSYLYNVSCCVAQHTRSNIISPSLVTVKFHKISWNPFSHSKQNYLISVNWSEIVNSQTNFEKIKVWLCSQLYNDLALLGNKATANSIYKEILRWHFTNLQIPIILIRWSWDRPSYQNNRNPYTW